MKTLKDAVRSILLEAPMFSIVKQGHKIDDDFISIIEFIKKNKGSTEKINIKNQMHVEKLVRDKSILKRYFSSEIHNELKYLALIELGIEYLYYTCELEDTKECKEILCKKINEEKMKLYQKMRGGKKCR